MEAPEPVENPVVASGLAGAGLEINHLALAFTRREPIGTVHLAGKLDLLARAEIRAERGPGLRLAVGLRRPLDQAGGMDRL